MKSQKPAKRKCMIRGCGREARPRGLCQACYALARAKIKSGEASEAEMVQLKLILPKKRRGPRAAFQQEFERVRAKA